MWLLLTPLFLAFHRMAPIAPSSLSFELSLNRFFYLSFLSFSCFSPLSAHCLLSLCFLSHFSSSFAGCHWWARKTPEGRAPSRRCDHPALAGAARAGRSGLVVVQASALKLIATCLCRVWRQNGPCQAAVFKSRK